MQLTIGIVGLPNVGKSTLFNALTGSSQAAAANFPFCTIDPNVGLVEVPDPRIDALAAIVQPERVVRSAVEFVDIAGLVEGASKGEGLGNQFLSHIRECQAICHVVRAFEGSDIHHVHGSTDPARDLSIIMTELILADLESAERQRERLLRKAKSGDKEAIADSALLERIIAHLQAEQLLRTLPMTEEEQERARRFQLLTGKPYLIVANVAEDALADFSPEAFATELGQSGMTVIPISAQVESELSGLSEVEAAEYLSSIGVSESGLSRLIHAAFALLGLQSYFTAGKKEVRAWTIRQGDTAPQAAGAIHSDFERGFIKAQVIGYEDFIAAGSEQAAKDAGKMRQEGKTYRMHDGDVVHFQFNV
ncbi:redox-regulated ATPase YchF [Candidatus Peribacteria bacterium]|nr:redox-regulated ATPase YchF [Candidatus Peribacteria bacterium]